MKFACASAIAIAAAVSTACWPSRPVQPPFGVVRTSPVLAPGAAPLLLNDAITVYFTADVDPFSVTADSFTVLDAAGHQVPGSLRVGSNWVSFEPRPPMSADLVDGSFAPASDYTLSVAGYPRPDAIRAKADGRRLAAPASFPIRTAPRGRTASGLPEPLRPPPLDLPFLLRTDSAPGFLPMDAPRLRVHFTLPVLPRTATADAFQIFVLRERIEELAPRSVRVVTSPLADFPGGSVEIDLGEPRLAGTDERVALRPKEWVSLMLRSGAASLRDYAGRPVQMPAEWTAQHWLVVPGASVALVDWPGPDMPGGQPAEDPLMPDFEFVDGRLRPRVRVEAGDGSLGVFRPRRDTVLRPGQPFDRGDGVEVRSRGGTFAFLAIDVPAGVHVRVDGSAGPVQLLSCGGVHVAGTLELTGPAVPVQLDRFDAMPVRELVETAAIAVVAAGDVHVTGRVLALLPAAADASPLLLAAAGRIHLGGDLPYRTVLACETNPGATASAIIGPRGQAVVALASFTYGVPRGADFAVSATTRWRQLPADRDGGTLRVHGASPELRVGWQFTSPDPVRRGEPDLRTDRIGRLQVAADGDRVVASLGAFVRFRIDARVVGGLPVPQLQALRLLDP